MSLPDLDYGDGQFAPSQQSRGGSGARTCLIIAAVFVGGICLLGVCCVGVTFAALNSNTGSATAYYTAMIAGPDAPSEFGLACEGSQAERFATEFYDLYLADSNSTSFSFDQTSEEGDIVTLGGTLNGDPFEAVLTFGDESALFGFIGTCVESVQQIEPPLQVE